MTQYCLRALGTERTLLLEDLLLLLSQLLVDLSTLAWLVAVVLGL